MRFHFVHLISRLTALIRRIPGSEKSSEQRSVRTGEEIWYLWGFRMGDYKKNHFSRSKNLENEFIALFVGYLFFSRTRDSLSRLIKLFERCAMRKRNKQRCVLDHAETDDGNDDGTSISFINTLPMLNDLPSKSTSLYLICRDTENAIRVSFDYSSSRAPPWHSGGPFIWPQQNSCRKNAETKQNNNSSLMEAYDNYRKSWIML